MAISVAIVNGPLDLAGPWGAEGAGAVLTFEGVVRPREGDADISALEYDAYEPMARSMLTELAESMVQAHGLSAISVEHSVGRVGVGQTSFRLRIASKHRAEGLAAAAEFITKMKVDVPLFKVPK